MTAVKKSAAKKSSTSKGLPFILLLLLITIIVYGVLRITHVSSPFSTSTSTPIVQEKITQPSMDTTVNVIEESSLTADSDEFVTEPVKTEKLMPAEASNDDFSGDFIGL